MRVLLFMVFFVIPLYSFFQGPLTRGGENPLSANSETLVAFWGALCGSARENFPASTPYTLHPPLKKHPKKRFLFAFMQKKPYLCIHN